MATTLTRGSPRAHAGVVDKSRPDPEVPEKPQRRRFTAEYKLGILEEADRATEPGEVGALLRREGLYSSHLAAWREQRREGTLQGLSQRRGRKGRDPRDRRIEELQRERDRLAARLEQAETIIAVQKKLSQLLGIETPTGEDTER
jgi:transposase